MPYAIRTDDVRAALAPVLGPRFVMGTPLCEQAAGLLRAYRPSRMTLEDMYRQMKNCIFGCLFELLGHQMLLQLENGAVRRILLQDVDFMVDQAVGVLLAAMPPAELPMEQLRAHAMERGSLSAMRLLLTRHDRELPEMEKEMLRRILRENFPGQ